MATYAFSDLHGNLDLYKQIKEYVESKDTLYCLGDCGDRGNEPWKTIKEVAKDPQIFYIKGNHEDMLVKAAREVLNPNDMDWGYKYQYMLANNGGMETLEQLLKEPHPEVWVKHLASLPSYIIYTNTTGQDIFLSHAGCSFWADEPDKIPEVKDLLWDRLHFYDNCRLLGSKIVVHGHTPIKYLASEIGEQVTIGALRYADGKKYCIDAGTYRSGRAILFNLDTFESIEFKS